MTDQTLIIEALNRSYLLPKNRLNYLINKAKKGNIYAKDQICFNYMRYIYSLAKRYAEKSHYPIEDLFNDGILGLLESIKSYDPQKGSFTTHLLPWVLKHFRKTIGSKKDKPQILEFNEEFTDSLSPYINENPAKLAMDYRLFKADFYNNISKYSDEEQMYLSDYWGLQDLEPLSIPKIAKKHKVPYSQVQRTLFNLTKKLQDNRTLKSLWEDYQAIA